VRVLVVEDVRRLADDIAEGLRDNAMAVDVAYDGLDAAAKLDIHRYDVVVLDRDLPGMHGDDICRILAARNDAPLVLMLTAASHDDDRIRGLDIGADDYLSKPFAFAELVLRVRALARRRPTAIRPVTTVGSIELDQLRRRVSRHGRFIHLSVKEFAVLETLIHAHPAVVSSETLLESVWDEHADPFTKTVQVTVSRLRRKLGPPPIIQTISGVGYHLRETTPTDNAP
jgi:DNA-binding response OmpR family regulator